MNLNKKLVVGSSFLILSLSVNSAYAGIPVIDYSAITQNAKNFVETVAHYGKEISKMEAQINNQVKQIEAETGIKDVMDSYEKNKQVFDDLQQLSQQFKSPKDILNYGKDALSNETRNMLNSEGFFKACDLMSNDESRKICENGVITKFSGIDIQNNALKALESSSKTLNTLSKQVGKSKDSKTSADLTNQLLIQQSIVNNQQQQLNLAEKRQEQLRLMVDEAKKNRFNSGPMANILGNEKSNNEPNWKTLRASKSNKIAW